MVRRFAALCTLITLGATENAPAKAPVTVPAKSLKFTVEDVYLNSMM